MVKNGIIVTCEAPKAKPRRAKKADPKPAVTPPEATHADLPIPEQIRWLSGGNDMEPDTSSTTISPGDGAKQRNDDSGPLEPELSRLLRKLLAEERRRSLDEAEERQHLLRLKIEKREAQWDDGLALDEMFAEYLKSLPDDQHPKSSLDKSRLHIEWHENFTQEIADWKKELAELENQTIDKQLIFNRARERLMRLFRREAEAAGLLLQEHSTRELGSNDNQAEMTSLTPADQLREPAKLFPPDSGGPVTASEGILLSELGFHSVQGRRPRRLRLPTGEVISTKSWADLLAEIAEWLIQRGQITSEDCPIHIGKWKTALIDKSTIFSPKGTVRSQRELPGGFFLLVDFNGPHCVEISVKLLERCRENPSRFGVQLS